MGSERNHRWLQRLAFVVCLLVVYHANGVYCVTADSAPNIALSLSILEDGDFEYPPSAFPMMFLWHLQQQGDVVDLPLTAWDSAIQELADGGTIQLHKERPIVVPSKRHPDQFVSTFGPGPGVIAVPFFAAIEATVGNLRDHPFFLWYGGKFVAALCVALAALCIWETASLWLSRRTALVVALVYALATGAWTTGSQGLTQHGPAEFFLALACYAMARWPNQLVGAALCGFALSAGTVCRPTTAIFVILVACDYLLRNRKQLGYFIVAGLPLAILLGIYQTIYLGAPWTFGQSSIDYLAVEKTGHEGLFQTPLWLGAAGLLLSPSRGLLVFSPVLLFSFAGAWRIWRESRFDWLRCWSLGVLLVWCIEFKHFDWWGGWSYGYRHIVDTTPILALLLIPVAGAIVSRRWKRNLFIALFSYSVAVQLLGAFCYDASGWNARRGFAVLDQEGNVRYYSPDERRSELVAELWNTTAESVEMDIDKPEFRGRLWSLTDSQIVYYVTHCLESRQRQREMSTFFTRPKTDSLALNHFWLAQSFQRLGNTAASKRWLESALVLDPDFSPAKEMLDGMLNSDEPSP